MQLNPFAILAIVLVAIVGLAFFFYKKNHPTYNDIKVDMPDVKRQGILYGYYGSGREIDYDNTKDHCNLFWYAGFFGFNYDTYLLGQEVIRIFRETNQKILIDLAPWLTTWTSPDPKKRQVIIHPQAEALLRGVFDQLRSEGLLHKINYLVINDEPQLHTVSKEEHLKMIELAKRVAAEYEELKPRWVCIYLNFEDFWNIEHFDVVGVDSYKQKSEVLTKGEHARLLKAKLPHQTTLILPGCAYGQDPVPFVNWAHANADVEMVVPFLWFANFDHGTDGSNGSDTIGLEIRDPAFKQLWIDQAHVVTQQ